MQTSGEWTCNRVCAASLLGVFATPAALASLRPARGTARRAVELFIEANGVECTYTASLLGIFATPAVLASLGPARGTARLAVELFIEANGVECTCWSCRKICMSTSGRPIKPEQGASMERWMTCSRPRRRSRQGGWRRIRPLNWRGRGSTTIMPCHNRNSRNPWPVPEILTSCLSTFVMLRNPSLALGIQIQLELHRVLATSPRRTVLKHEQIGSPRNHQSL